jgi:hypothetical protein
MAKPIPWACTDAHARTRGEQTGLDTLVVHALNDDNWLLDGLLLSNDANACSCRGGEYGRKVETQWY